MTETKLGSPTPSRRPRKSTRDRLLDTAGILLDEVGMERISTNLICERTGVTPPALYYYFGDKYEVVVALGERLMERQNIVLEEWIARHAGGDMTDYADGTAELLRKTAEVTEAEPGGIGVERALHSTPRLEHVRIDSHRHVTERLTDTYVPLLPFKPRALIWRRVRMMVEFGYAAIELLHAESGVEREAILSETAHMLKIATLDLAAA